MPKADIPTRSVSFRMPVSIYEDFQAIATLHGMDLSALLNSVCVEALPGLLRWKAEHETEIAAARLSQLSELLATGSKEEAIAALRKLSDQLHDLHRAIIERS